MSIINAPSKNRWRLSRGLHHITRPLRYIPVLRSIVKKREIAYLARLAQNSATQMQKFNVLDSGWARKKVPFAVENVLASLERIDKTNRSIFYGVPQSRHWSRVFEYPYTVHQFNHIQQGGRLLECGAGITPLQFYLAKKGFEVYSLDPWLPYLEKVAVWKKNWGLSNLKLVYGNLFRLPFANSYFDGVSCISIIEHLLDKFQDFRLILKTGLGEMLRVLKKGAPLVLTFDVYFGKEQRGPTIAHYAQLCRLLGIKTSKLPEDRLYSSDTKEGRIAGEDLAVYSITLTKS